MFAWDRQSASGCPHTQGKFLLFSSSFKIWLRILAGRGVQPKEGSSLIVPLSGLSPGPFPCQILPQRVHTLGQASSACRSPPVLFPTVVTSHTWQLYMVM